MAQRYFTTGEVERMIPALEKIFLQVVQIRGALQRQQEKLELAGVRLTRDSLEHHDPGDPRKVRDGKAMFRAFYETLTDEVARIERLGGQVKDIEQGLVDFPGKRGSEDILLCWRLGEKQIGYWHAVDGGFRSRQPIDKLVPREPPPLD